MKQEPGKQPLDLSLGGQALAQNLENPGQP